MRIKSRGAALAATVTVVLASAAAALATAPTGETPTPLARGQLLAPANVNRPLTGGRVRLKTAGAIDALMVEITLAPGGTGGWHSHAGPHITIVKQGTLTLVDAKCQSHQLAAGQAAIDSGAAVTEDENKGTTPVTFDVTFLLPHDATSPRIDQPAPPGCNA
jgi:quercetin dioxygenase-like cupin family protein